MKYFVLSLLLCLPCLTAGAVTYEFAYTYEGATLCYDRNFAGAIVVDRIRVSNNVIIPNAVTFRLTSAETTTEDVNQIGPGAFQGCTDMSSLTLPEAISSIYSEAFKGCTNLTSVKNLSKAKSIRQKAFMDCGSLTSVDLSSAESIEQQAFCNCISLTSVILPDKLTAINDGVFSGCKKLRNITIPSNVKSIGIGAFQDCSSLTSINIPNNVSSIGKQAFNGCTGLMAINALRVTPPKVNDDCFDAITYQNATLYVPAESIETYRKTYPWSNFHNIQSNNIQEFKFSYDYSNATATVIGYDKEKLSHNPVIPKEIRLQNKIYTVSAISDGAFSGCTALTSIDIPDGIISIGSEAFKDCIGLTSVNIHDVAAWCNIKFNNADGNPLSIAHNLYLNGEKVTNLVIPDGIKSINDYAFHSCSSLTSVDIPNSITGISGSAFSGCTGLTSVNIHDVAAWCNIKFNNANENPLSIAHNLYLNGEKVTNLVIPDGIMSINNYAFYGCSSLTSVDIPNSVTGINNYAFYGCSSLTSVDIPNSVTGINNYAFYSCSSLTSVTIPKDVTAIYRSAFSGCTNLKQVNIHDLAAWCNIKFERADANPLRYAGGLYLNGEKVTNLVIPEGVTTINNYAFNDYTGLSSVDIPNTVTTIGDEAFRGCTGLTTISSSTPTPPNIGTLCFYNVNANTTVYVPHESVIKYKRAEGWKDLNIQSNAIGLIYSYDTDKRTATVTGINAGYHLPHITIPATTTYQNQSYTVVAIGERVFQNDTDLKTVAISKHVTSIGSYAFDGCSGLTSLNIPNGVTSIGSSAFKGCSGLTSITIPNSVTSIGNYAFSGCSSLTSVTISNSITNIGWNCFSGCSSLTSIYALNPTPSSIENDCFDNSVYQNATLYVPQQSIQKYKEENGWKKFNNIQVLNELGLEFSYDTNNKTATVTGFDKNRLPSNLTIPATTEYLDQEYHVMGIGNDAFADCGELISVDIPNSVASIGSNAFKGCCNMTSINIPNSVGTIYSDAFDGCTCLTTVNINDIAAWCNIYFSNINANPLSITHNIYLNGEKVTDLVIPDGVKSISNKAFYGCTGLTSVDIPNSIRTVNYTAFKDCTGLKEVNIHDVAAWCGITFSDIWANPLYYGHNLYLNGEKVTNLVIPDGVKSISNNAFYGCSGLNSVKISQGVTTIGTDAFNGCTGLASVDIPNSVRTVNYTAFKDCTGLKEVNIHDIAAWCDITFSYIWANPLYYGHNLYLNGEKVTNLVIPDGVKSISNNAFYGCSGLNSVKIPDGILVIKEDVFCDCSGLTSISIPNSVRVIEQYAFNGCNNLASIYSFNPMPPEVADYNFDDSNYQNATLYVPDDAVEEYKTTLPWRNFKYIYGLNEDILKYTYNVSDMTATVAGFKEGVNLQDLVIPEMTTYQGQTYKVVAIGNGAFQNCSGLISVTIPNSVTTIGSYAFDKCRDLTSVTIPNSVTTIGSYAFYDCTGLTAVNIQDITAWCNIDFADAYSNPVHYNNLYLNGEKITELVIPNGVKTIKKYTFYRCSNLTSVTIPNSVTTIGKRAFQGCTGLTSVNIQDITAWCNIDFDDAFSNPIYNTHNLYLNGEKITELVIPNGTQTIKQYAFYYCSGLTSVTIPKSITAIGSHAFGYCNGLTSVTIPNSVTTIGNGAFINCTNLTSVSIPNSVTTIGSYAFNFCSGLTSVTIGNSVTTIGDRAFFYCSGLTSVTIPNSVTAIGEMAFSYCSGLTSVTIGNSVKTIGHDAFEGCSGLTTIYSLNPTPPSALLDNGYESFADDHYQKATLYVPKESLDAYKTADVWKKFQNIQGFDPTGIKGIEADGNNKQDVYYDISGRKLNAPVKGLNIINGKKVIIK